MTKSEYIKSRTQYYREGNDGVKMTIKMAKELAEEDYDRYCEKYGEESLKNR